MPAPQPHTPTSQWPWPRYDPTHSSSASKSSRSSSWTKVVTDAWRRSSARAPLITSSFSLLSPHQCAHLMTEATRGETMTVHNRPCLHLHHRITTLTSIYPQIPALHCKGPQVALVAWCRVQIDNYNILQAHFWKYLSAYVYIYIWNKYIEKNAIYMHIFKVKYIYWLCRYVKQPIRKPDLPNCCVFWNGM